MKRKDDLCMKRLVESGSRHRDLVLSPQRSCLALGPPHMEVCVYLSAVSSVDACLRPNCDSRSRHLLRDLQQWDERSCFANMGYKLVVFGISGSHGDVRCESARRAFMSRR